MSDLDKALAKLMTLFDNAEHLTHEQRAEFVNLFFTSIKAEGATIQVLPCTKSGHNHYRVSLDVESVPGAYDVIEFDVIVKNDGTAKIINDANQLKDPMDFPRPMGADKYEHPFNPFSDN